MCGNVWGPPQSSISFGSRSSVFSDDGIEVGHLVEHAHFEATFTAGAVVAGDVDEQRIVLFRRCLQWRLTRRPISWSVCSGSRRTLPPDERRLSSRRRSRCIPVLDVIELWEAVWYFAGIMPIFFLACKGGLAHLVPTLVKLAFVLVSPVARDVVRGMNCAGCKIHEEWLVRRHRLLRLDPAGSPDWSCQW